MQVFVLVVVICSVMVVLAVWAMLGYLGARRKGGLAATPKRAAPVLDVTGLPAVPVAVRPAPARAALPPIPRRGHRVAPRPPSEADLAGWPVAPGPDSSTARRVVLPPWLPPPLPPVRAPPAPPAVQIVQDRAAYQRQLSTVRVQAVRHRDPLQPAWHG